MATYDVCNFYVSGDSQQLDTSPIPSPAIQFLVSPSCFEGEACGITSVAPQRAEWPGDQLGARVVNVPQVNVFMGDLHHALPIDVQVGTGEEEHVETL